MSIKNTVANKIFKTLSKSRFMYKLSNKYVNYCNGENNSDFNTNGELNFIEKNLDKCKVVFDVGANIGEWTKSALKINSRLNIHCFEPSKFTFNQLKNNDFPQNIYLNKLGLGSHLEEKQLYIFDDGSTLNSLFQRDGLEEGWDISTPERTENIKIETLDNYCKERHISNIDFLKIDVEGYELEVFRGGKNIFVNHQVKMIQFEYGGCNIDARLFLYDIFNFFKGMNYSFYKIYPNNIRLAKRYDKRFDNFNYQNWLIIDNDYYVDSSK